MGCESAQSAKLALSGIVYGQNAVKINQVAKGSIVWIEPKLQGS